MAFSRVHTYSKVQQSPLITIKQMPGTTYRIYLSYAGTTYRVYLKSAPQHVFIVYAFDVWEPGR